MLYLGLGPDEEYEQYEVDEPMPAAEPAERAVSRGGGRGQSTGFESRGPDTGDVQVSGAVRTITPQPVEPISERAQAAGLGTAGAAVRPRGAVVRPLPATVSAKPHVMSPTSFNEAQEVADKYKANTPVIVNLQAVDRDLSRRMIDFASGLCYGLGGSMEKVANQVYLLTPSNVEVPAEERRRFERGVYD
jgi:cell division inhibitor SepF